MTENDIEKCLMDIGERLARIEAKLSNGIPTQLKDHEKRIRKIEKWRNILTGIFGVIQVLALAALGWVGVILKGLVANGK